MLSLWTIGKSKFGVVLRRDSFLIYKSRGRGGEQHVDLVTLTFELLPRMSIAYGSQRVPYFHKIQSLYGLISDFFYEHFAVL